VRTVSGPNEDQGLSAKQYVKVCYLKGKAYRGHVATKTELPKRKGK
jgi:hypothetical protein